MVIGWVTMNFLLISEYSYSGISYAVYDTDFS